MPCSVCSDQAAVTHSAPAATEHCEASPQGYQTQSPRPRDILRRYFGAHILDERFTGHEQNPTTEYEGDICCDELLFRDFGQMLELLRLNINNVRLRLHRYCIKNYYKVQMTTQEAFPRSKIREKHEFDEKETRINMQSQKNDMMVNIYANFGTIHDMV